VVLVSSGCDTPQELVNALGSRGLAPEVVRDEPSVMMRLAELAALRGGKRVLVIVQPQRVDRLAELVCAVQAHHRDVLCWQYVDRGQGAERLTMLDRQFNGPVFRPADGDAWQGDGDLGEGDGPVGQIIGRRRPLDKLLVKVPGRPLTSREIVTQQELTMLLGPVPGEAS